MNALRITALAWVIALAMAPAALAQQATESGYQDVGGSVETRVVDRDTNGNDPRDAAQTTVRSDDGDLPFTGLDVAIVALIGAGLLGLGLGVRALGRRQTASG